jgi:hypothetical protein
MTASLSDRIQQSRLMVVEVDTVRGWLRLRGESDVWGSPHFDLAANRSGYRRPLPSLIDLARSR